MDANYTFKYIDVGTAQRAGDAGVFNNSLLKLASQNGLLKLSEPRKVSEKLINYHKIKDDAFPKSLSLMKPHSYRHLEKEKRIFKYPLSRAKRVVENAFGIMANRFCVFTP